MAEINMSGGNQHKRRGHRANPKVDLTPMVDLGFLLITFFMLTASLKKDYLIDLKTPVPGPATHVPESAAMTVVLGGGDKYYYYLGQDIDKMDSVNSSNEIRTVLTKQNAPLIDSIKRFRMMFDRKQMDATAYEGEIKRVSHEQWALTVVVKAKDKTQCQQLVSIMDQLQKAKVSKYAIVDMGPSEKLAMGK